MIPLFIKCVEKYMSISIEDININKYSKMAVKHHINEIKNLIYELDITRYNPKQRVSHNMMVILDGKMNYIYYHA